VTIVTWYSGVDVVMNQLTSLHTSTLWWIRYREQRWHSVMSKTILTVCVHKHAVFKVFSAELIDAGLQLQTL